MAKLTERLLRNKAASLQESGSRNARERLTAFEQTTGSRIGVNIPDRGVVPVKVWRDAASHLVGSVKVAGTTRQNVIVSDLGLTFREDPVKPTVSHAPCVAQIIPEPHQKKGVYTGTFAAAVWTKGMSEDWQKIGYMPKEFQEKFPVTENDLISMELTDYSNGKQKNVSYTLSIDLEMLADKKRADLSVKQGCSDLTKREPFSQDTYPVGLTYARPVQFDGVITDKRQVTESFLAAFPLESQYQNAIWDANRKLKEPRKELPKILDVDLRLASDGSGYFLFCVDKELTTNELFHIDESLLSPLGCGNKPFGPVWANGQGELHRNSPDTVTRRVPNEQFVLVTGVQELVDTKGNLPQKATEERAWHPDLRLDDTVQSNLPTLEDALKELDDAKPLLLTEEDLAALSESEALEQS